VEHIIDTVLPVLPPSLVWVLTILIIVFRRVRRVRVLVDFSDQGVTS
jgi:hypothetical protein